MITDVNELWILANYLIAANNNSGFFSKSEYFDPLNDWESFSFSKKKV